MTIVADEPEFTARTVTHKTTDGKDLLFIHLEVFYFSAGVLRTMLKRFAEFRKVTQGPIFACATEPTKRWERFVAKSGFRFLMDVECSDGLTRPLFISI